jgi:hypothetical protein
MAVNRELIERKITLILNDLEKLWEITQPEISEYLADFKNEESTRRSSIKP